MKKLLALLLALVMVLCLAACGDEEKEGNGGSTTESTTEATTEATNEATQGATEPEPTIGLFDKDAAADVIGAWKLELIVDGSVLQLDDFTYEAVFPLIFTFGEDGTMSMGFDQTTLADSVDSYNAALADYLVDVMYDQFNAEGFSKDGADKAFQDAHGKSIAEYVDEQVKAMDIASLFAQIGAEGVYYVEDGKIYSSDSWDGTFEINSYTVEGDTLTLLDSNMEGNWESMGVTLPAELTRVTE